jgi:hypothetical protein
MSASDLSCAEDFWGDILVPDQAVDDLEPSGAEALHIGLAAEQAQAVRLVYGLDFSVLIFE